MGKASGTASADAESVGEHFKQHSDWLTARLRRRLGDAAEDVVQDAFMRLAGAGAAVRHPRALLHTIAANLAANGERSSRREAVAFADLHERVAASERPTQVEAIMIKEIILGLPEPLKSVFLLARFEGLNDAEIGARLGISAKTAKRRLAKALAHCAAELRR